VNLIEILKNSAAAERHPGYAGVFLLTKGKLMWLSSANIKKYYPIKKGVS